MPYEEDKLNESVENEYCSMNELIDKNKRLVSDNQGLKYERVDLINNINQLKKDWVSKQNRIEELENYLKEPDTYKQKIEKIADAIKSVGATGDYPEDAIKLCSWIKEILDMSDEE